MVDKSKGSSGTDPTSARVLAALSKETRDVVTKAARRHGIPVAAWVERTLLDGASRTLTGEMPPTTMPPELFAMLKDISRTVHRLDQNRTPAEGGIQNLQKTAHEIGERLSATYDEWIEKGGRTLDEVGPRTDRLMDDFAKRTSDAIDQVRKATSSAVDTIREAAGVAAEPTRAREAPTTPSRVTDASRPKRSPSRAAPKRQTTPKAKANNASTARTAAPTRKPARKAVKRPTGAK